MKTTISSNCSLFEAVKHFPCTTSNTTLRSWIKEGRVYVNGMARKDERFQVKPGDELVLDKKKLFLYPGVEILYEDGDCIVVTKPANLLSVDSLDPDEISLHQILKGYAKPNRVYPVQRLDESTSGVMVYALNFAFKELLKEQFERHSIIREYHAIVIGKMPEKKGRWTNLLKEDKQYFVHVRDDFGEEAITDYEVLEENSKFSFVNFKLFTGRKNQIRVQSAHHGFPLLGDTKYGKDSGFSFDRLALHAHTLGFYHPTLKKEMKFELKTPFTLKSAN
jgi:tRNA pseudouridine32 synthase/23S rRNA pseudouridine746 synthase/23S rRNA pseudouridine1911/1915/1917 synthase